MYQMKLFHAENLACIQVLGFVDFTSNTLSDHFALTPLPQFSINLLSLPFVQKVVLLDWNLCSELSLQDTLLIQVLTGFVASVDFSQRLWTLISTDLKRFRTLMLGCWSLSAWAQLNVELQKSCLRQLAVIRCEPVEWSVVTVAFPMPQIRHVENFVAQKLLAFRLLIHEHPVSSPLFGLLDRGSEGKMRR